MRRLALVFTLVAVLTAAGCAKPKKKDVEAIDTAVATENLGDSDSGTAMGLQTVHFPYDAFVLDTEAKNKLKENAQILKDNSNVQIQVEGHADQRGGIQYNLALGEKRANAVKRYIVDQGISGDRITTISYGKENPIDPAFTEDAFAKNRRANFVITSK